MRLTDLTDFLYKLGQFLSAVFKNYFQSIISRMVFGNFFRKPTSLLAFAQRCIPYVSFVGSPFGTNIPVNMDYGMYPLCDRYSMDQVPEQNRVSFSQ